MADEQNHEQEAPGVTEVAVTTPVEAVTAVVAAVSADDLGKVRGLVLQAHPDVVPDLVKGGSIDELLASVEPARSAYQQIAEKVRGSIPTITTTTPEAVTVTAVVTPPVVPAGGTAAVVDPAVLGPTTKIAQALAARRKR